MNDTNNKDGYELPVVENSATTISSDTTYVTVHKYSPKAIDVTKRSPNPTNIEVGQIWISEYDQSLE